MKKKAFFYMTGVLFMSLMSVGFVVEFLATSIADPNSCLLSPHNKGCENNLPIVLGKEEIENGDLENYFISETLSNYFANEFLSEQISSEYLSHHFEKEEPQ
ncbi:hypothetical protein [Spirulina sp. 06S082]|uniref:hypothetical protein n=1 Tax=Spirulina sp. 06S082 TaxID=3110248 RepID=UPI002B205095|nr:hypothetical protein [Spirulina sp. 06S082]MEA5472050.1 hypothetical protein [Spirulina sp. 06S082]